MISSTARSSFTRTAVVDPPEEGRRLPLVAVAVLAVITVVVSLITATPPSGADPGPRAARYTNAVSASFADTFADPSVIEGKDGWWYAYSTADPLRSGDAPGIMHIARTKDWVSWEYRGTVFDDTNRPSYATATAGLWAPDVRYLGGRYVLYFTVTDTTLNAGDDPGIGVATAPTPEGPWVSTDAPIVAPRLRPGTTDFLGTIDPAGFTDVSGQHYLYFGGFNGGFWGTKVSADGLTAEPDYTQVAIDNRYEGGYVVRHDGWYYFMASSANCCAGPATGYTVWSGRSRSPLGPFVDADGRGLMDSRVGGTLMLAQNGNTWIGAGHHAIATDAEGRDFIVYHAIDRDDAWLDQPFGINRRPMLIDRIDWIDGWPRTRAGAGPSDTPQPAPVTGSALGIRSDDPARAGFSGLTAGRDAQGGAVGIVRSTAATRATTSGDVRVRLDVRADRPVTLTLGDAGRDHGRDRGRDQGRGHRADDQVRVVVDPAAGRLSATTVVDGRTRTATTPLGAIGAGWQTLVVEVDRGTVLARVGESDLGDPRAELRLDRPGLRLDRAPVRLSGSRTVIDNVTVRTPAREATRLVDVPTPVRTISTETFDDPALPGWTWLRRNPDATVAGGRLTWPVEGSDLVGDRHDAGVLLRDAPGDGDWIVETKVTLDLGTETVRNYQQAGLVVYRSDDDFARLSTVAIWNTRQTEYGRELAAAPDGRTIYGGALIGTPGPTTWLRIAHHRNAAGEHLYRAATSNDGRSWTWGAVWTFAPGDAPRIGLVAQGGATPAVSAEFDHVRFSTARWPR